MKSGRDLSRIIKFLRQPDWEERFDDVLDDHVGPAEEEFDLDWEDFASVLGEHWHLTLWGCALEDMLTRRFEPDEANLVDEYLKRRGWNETTQAKTYLRALQASVPSLYEVSDIKPGISFQARDLLRGGEPILISEKSATQTLKPWDRLSTRVIRLGGKAVMTGGALSFSLEASELLDEELRAATDQQDRRKKLALDDETLRRFAPLFSIAWLFDVLPKVLGERTPRLRNSEGNDLLFHRIRFPVRDAAAVTPNPEQIR